MWVHIMFISSQAIRDFWEALASVVHGSFEKVSMVDVQSYRATWDVEPFHAESALSLVRDKEDPQA